MYVIVFRPPCPLKWSCGSTVFALDFHLFEEFRLLPSQLLSCMKGFHLRNISDVLVQGDRSVLRPDWAQSGSEVDVGFSICLLRVGASSKTMFAFPLFWKKIQTQNLFSTQDMFAGFTSSYFVVVGADFQIRIYNASTTNNGSAVSEMKKWKIKTVIFLWICFKTLLKMLFFCFFLALPCLMFWI